MEGEFENLQRPENKNKLTVFLNNHVIKGRTYYRDFKDGQQLTNFNGTTLLVSVKDDVVSVNGVLLLKREREGVNGLVHGIDSVIKP